jgi:hypothetical protein
MPLEEAAALPVHMSVSRVRSICRTAHLVSGRSRRRTATWGAAPGGRRGSGEVQSAASDRRSPHDTTPVVWSEATRPAPGSITPPTGVRACAAGAGAAAATTRAYVARVASPVGDPSAAGHGRGPRAPCGTAAGVWPQPPPLSTRRPICDQSGRDDGSGAERGRAPAPDTADGVMAPVMAFLLPMCVALVACPAGRSATLAQDRVDGKRGDVVLIPSVHSLRRPSLYTT